MTKHAFIVDDAAAMRRLVMRGARGLGLELLGTEPAAAGARAAELPDAGCFDLLLSEIAGAAGGAAGTMQAFMSEDLDDVNHPMLL